MKTKQINKKEIKVIKENGQKYSLAIGKIKIRKWKDLEENYK